MTSRLTAPLALMSALALTVPGSVRSLPGQELGQSGGTHALEEARDMLRDAAGASA